MFQELRHPSEFLQGAQSGKASRPVWIHRMSPAPFRSCLVKLDLKRRVWRTEVFLGVCHIPSRASVLAQFEIAHLAEALSDSIEVFGVGLNAHGSS
jgi:hypothetical protein